MTQSQRSALEAAARKVARRGRSAVRTARDPEALNDMLIAAGLRKYEPKPWTTERWNDDYESGALDYFGQLNERPRFSVIVGYLEHVAATGRILDAGCGNGFLFKRASHLDFAEWRGVDLSSTAVDLASERAESDGRAIFRAEDLLDTSASWFEHDYECVVINEVLNMCDDPAQVLRNVIDRLRPSPGHLIISGWRHRGDRHLWSLIDEHARTLDAVQLIPDMNDLAPKGWRVALLEPR